MLFLLSLPVCVIYYSLVCQKIVLSWWLLVPAFIRCFLVSSPKWDERRPGRVPAKLTNWSFHWMFSFPTPADKQSPGARQPPTSHPYRQLRTLNKEGHFKGGTLQRGGDTSCNTRGDGGHFQWSFTPGWENPYSFQKCSTAEKTHFLCDISNIAWISFIMHPDKKECIDILCDISYMRAYKGGERHNAEEPQARPEIVK